MTAQAVPPESGTTAAATLATISTKQPLLAGVTLIQALSQRSGELSPAQPQQPHSPDSTEVHRSQVSRNKRNILQYRKLLADIDCLCVSRAQRAQSGGLLWLERLLARGKTLLWCHPHQVQLAGSSHRGFGNCLVLCKCGGPASAWCRLHSRAHAVCCVFRDLALPQWQAQQA